MRQPVSIAVLLLACTFAVSAQQQKKKPKPDPTPRPDPKADYAVVNAFPGQKPFARPIHLDHHPADPDVYYVVEQYGHIYRVPRDGKQTKRSLFLDWSEQCLHPKIKGAHNEEGLLGFAFDPAFADNGFVYLYYSKKVGEQKSRRTGRMFPKRASIVSRMVAKKTASGARVADPSTELVIMNIPQPFGNHNGGTILFGKDGMLYIALGDGGYANDPYKHGQNLKTLLGSILRIDVKGATKDAPYKVPKDNPFVGREGMRGEIWAYGLRNPWRINLDRKTGDIFCADVGQNLWEEVDRIIKGGNYGWNKMEGTHPFPPTAKPTIGTVPPIVEYHHREGISITGGEVYRGNKMPELEGWYVYGDYVSGRLWAVKEDRSESRKHENKLLLRRAGAIASFAGGANGELFILRYDGNVISELVPNPLKKKAKAPSRD